MQPERHKIIRGERVGSEFSENWNPSDLSDLIGHFASGSSDDVRAAVDAAHAAFPPWSQSGIATRHAILRRTVDEILTRSAELGRLLAREEGKTLAEAVGEAVRASQIFDFSACGNMHDFAKVCDRFPAQCRSRNGDGEPADCRGGLLSTFRRTQGLKLWAKRSGTLRGRILYDCQDGVHPVLTEGIPEKAPRLRPGRDRRPCKENSQYC